MTLALAEWPLPVTLEGCTLLANSAHQLMVLLMPDPLQQVPTLVPSLLEEWRTFLPRAPRTLLRLK